MYGSSLGVTTNEEFFYDFFYEQGKKSIYLVISV